MLKGENVDLRLINESDLEWLRALRNIHANDFFTKDVISSQQQKAWYQKYSENVTDRMFIIQSKDGTHMGTVALYNINIADRSAELGRTIILSEYRGKGYMREAIKMLINHAFNAMRLWNIRLSVYLDNSAAIALYHECGFQSTQRPIMLMEARNYDMDHSKPVTLTDFNEDD